MSLFRGFMHDFDDDQFFGEMSVRKKNSVSYTIPADSEDDDDDDEEYNQPVRLRKERRNKSQNDTSAHMNPMNQMNSLMNSMFADPFGMFDGFGGSGRRGRGGGRDLMPFGFPNVNDIFQNFQMNMNNPNCHSFSSSTIMTMSSGPDGRPQVYQASQSTRTAPGGVRETKKSVCDSITGTKKMAIGHHIGERSHIKEREQNLHSGQVEEREDFINLDEEEAEDFNREWETKARSATNAIGYEQQRIRNRRQRDDIPSILDRSNKSKASSQSDTKKGWKSQSQKRGSRNPSLPSKYRAHSYPRSRITSRRHYPAITSSSSAQVAAEKGKKRSQEENISSDEENSGKKCKVLKSLRKKKH